MFNNPIIRKKLFGTDKLSEIVILTPIKDLFLGLFMGHEAIEERKHCWWTNKDIDIFGKRISFIKIPPGNAIIDAIASLDSPKLVFLIGYCGGISANLNIGDLVWVKKAVFLNNSFLSGFKISDSNVKKTILYHVDTFCEQNQEFISSLKKKEINCIDMETFLLYKRCEKRKIKCVSILIATDLPYVKPFYTIDDTDEKKVKEAYKKVEEAITNAVSQ